MAALAGLRAWPVSVSYYKHDGGADETPSYQVSFTLFDNGVSGDIKLDYGDFALDRQAHPSRLPQDQDLSLSRPQGGLRTGNVAQSDKPRFPFLTRRPMDEAPRPLLDVNRSLTGRTWHLRPVPERSALAIAQTLDVPELIARLLAGRGVTA